MTVARAAVAGGSNEATDELPEGWSPVNLPDICDINPAKPAANFLAADAPVTFVPMPALDANLGQITAPQVRPFSLVRNGYTSFREEDVIIAKITPCMENGKAAVARGLENGLGFGSTEFHVLRSNGTVIPDFVYYFIRQTSFRQAAEAEMTGTVGQKRVPVRFLEATELALPPFAEQKRIVAKVEELLARVDETRRRVSRVPTILRRFRQAVLGAACSGRLTSDWQEEHSDEEAAEHATLDVPEPLELPDIPTRWRWVPLKDVARSIQYGTSVKADADHSTGVAILRMANIQDGTLDLNDLKYIKGDSEDVERFTVHRGDILFNRTNSPELVGKAAIYDNALQAVFASYLIRVSCDVRLASSPFVCSWINSIWGRSWARTVRTDGVSQSNINAAKLKEMPLPLPSLEEQQEIARRVEALFRLANAIEKRVAAATAGAAKLTQSILAKAFRGELVPTEAELARLEGRDYEPASALLARIRTAHESPR